MCEINFEKFREWGDDDDDKWGREEGESGAASIFAWLFGLALVGSGIANIKLYQKWKDAATALARAPETSSSSSTYRAPLRQPGDADSQATPV